MNELIVELKNCRTLQDAKNHPAVKSIERKDGSYYIELKWEYSFNGGGGFCYPTTVKDLLKLVNCDIQNEFSKFGGISNTKSIVLRTDTILEKGLVSLGLTSTLLNYATINHKELRKDLEVSIKFDEKTGEMKTFVKADKAKQALKKLNGDDVYNLGEIQMQVIDRMFICRL